MISVSSFILLPLILSVLDAATDMCLGDFCRNKIRHVTCKFRRSDKCTSADFPDDTRTIKNQHSLLHSFNQFRNAWATGYGLYSDGLFPGATNMHQVSWSRELESYAYEACRRCLIDSGDDCRDTLEGSVAQLFYFKVFRKGRSPGDIEVFDAWVLDAAYMTVAAINKYSSFFDNLTAPTVLYWKLQKIGCSSAVITLKNGSFGRMVVCNLYPSGPLSGQPIYNAGNSCNGCEIGFKCSHDNRYPSLCSKQILTAEQMESQEMDSDPGDVAVLFEGHPSTIFIVFAICLYS